MMQKLFILFLICFSFHLSAKTNEKNNIIKLNELLSQASDSFYVSPERSYTYALKALELSSELKDDKLTAEAYYLIARACFAIRDYQTSIKYALFSEDLLIKLNDNFSLASLYSVMANCYYRLGEDEQFHFYSDKTIKIGENKNNHNALMEQYYTKAIRAREINDISGSVHYINKALALKNDSEESMQISHRCYNLMSVIYKDLGFYERSIDYYKLAINLAEKQTLFRDLIYYYSNISNLYNKLKIFDSAFVYCDKSLYAFEKVNIEPLKAIVYQTFSSYYSSKEQYDSAKYYINLAIKLKESFFQNVFDYYYEAGLIYYQSGDYDMALYYAKQANILAEEANFQVIKHNTDKLIADIYFITGVQEFAAYYYNQYIKGDTLKDITKSQQEILKLSEIIIKEKADYQLKEELNKRKKVTTFLFISAAFIGILIILLERLVNQKNKINHFNNELNEKKYELEQLVEYKNRQLDDKEQQYINLCNNMVNGAIFRIVFQENDIQEGKIVFASSGWEKMTNQKNNDVLFLIENIYPADKYILLNKIDSSIKNNTILDVSFRYYRDNNNTHWFHVRASATRSTEEDLIYLDGYLVDETEQKIFEEQLVEAKEKAEESDRLKSAFLNNISHEIRTPMNAIIGFSNMIMSGIIQEEERESFLKLINDNCFMLLNIINNIVEISKIETENTKLNLSNISLNEVRDDLKLWIIPAFKEKYPKVDFKLDNNFEFMGNLVFTTDKTFLTKIFEQLIDNAAKFTNEGIVEFNVSLEDKNIHFMVKDNGIGIEYENLDNIFGNFIKLHPQLYSGTGLGLPIIKRMIIKLGGRIWADSEINVGSTFHFLIPVQPVKK